MQWRGGRRSTNIEDRRGARVGLAGGGLGGIIILLVALYFGVDPGTITNTGFDSETPAAAPSSPADDAASDFVSAVVGYTEDTWSTIFREGGQAYRPPTLVLFSGAVQSACGLAETATGPFYCPRDERVYLDMSFFNELQSRFGAPGDFAQAYVIAHEVGHHVQNLLGAMNQAGRSNDASIRIELQADCFAGLWANRTEQAEQSQFREFLEAGDAQEALAAASAVGDDRLQMQQQGYVVPESFTHGTAEQRAQWFRRGLEAGSVSQCNTFAGG